MNIPRGERDTIITKLDSEDYWTVYTEDLTLIKKFKQQAVKHGLKNEDVGGYGLRLTVPKSWVKISAPTKRSEAQLAVLQKAREAKEKQEVS